MPRKRLKDSHKNVDKPRKSVRIATKVLDTTVAEKKPTTAVKRTSSTTRNDSKRARKVAPVDPDKKTLAELSKDQVNTSGTALVKEEKQEAMTESLPTLDKKYIGAHVSISGGLYQSVERASDIGAKSFAMFLRSQRQWVAKPLGEEDAQLFRDACKQKGFSPDVILPHGIYLMNCGSPDDETVQKSREVLLDELQRCEKLGLTLYNFHPGSTCGKISVEECIDRIAQSINFAHNKTKYVVTVLENMSCQGNTIGGKFEELKNIIEKVDDKSRVGVCLDTCHAFAAGYNLATAEGFNKMMSDFENIIGFQYLRAVHLNDSKGELGSHLDRHENIGRGKIGIQGFKNLMKDKRFNGIPMVLETPCESDRTYEREIELLYSIAG